MADGSEDTVIVVASVDPHSTRESTLRLDMGALGLGWDERVEVAVRQWGPHELAHPCS